MISLRALTKSYPGLRVLHEITMDFREGSVTALLGANGAGKTTLLRCLSGLSGGDSGAVLLDSEALAPGRLDLRRRLMFLPDFPLAMPGDDMLDHVAMHLNVWNRDRQGIEDHAVTWMEELDLLACAGKSVDSLSRGQRYKVALLCLLVVDPDIWLLDEPFASGMDARGIAVFRREALAAAQRGRTVIYSTQLVELAAAFSDVTAIIRDGNIAEFDTEHDLGRDPRELEQRLFPRIPGNTTQESS